MQVTWAAIWRRRMKIHPATRNPALSVLRHAFSSGSAVTSSVAGRAPPSPVMSAPTRPTTASVRSPITANAARSLMAFSSTMHDLASLDATAQADLVRRREVKPIELVDAAIARIERLNPELNAVVTPLYEQARAAA